MTETTITRHIFISGRVQGVGFRWSTQRIAADFAVTGFVRNLSNGRVELMAQGTPESTDTFVAAILDYFANNVDSVEDEIIRADESFGNFNIRR